MEEARQQTQAKVEAAQQQVCVNLFASLHVAFHPLLEGTLDNCSELEHAIPCAAVSVSTWFTQPV